MKIVTGYTGEAHITSADDQARNRAIFGSGNCVLNTGNKFSAAMTSATVVQVADGDGMIQGVHFRVEPGTLKTLEISDGASGFKRNDLIVARYTKESATGIEAVELIVIEGEPSATTATDPEYNTGDITDGATPIDFPLYRISLNGLTPTLENLFAGVPSAGGIADQIYPVGSIYMSVNSTNPSLLFGGTWEAWSVGRVPVGVNPNDADFNAADKYGGEKTHTLTKGEIPGHGHGYTAFRVDGTTPTQAGSVREAIVGGSTTSTTGAGDCGGGAHNNMPPYLTCYMWKRTA